ncbi:MAG: CoB--CoM heterodisulfide reductase iron-sulfur subunit A family protein [Methanophagales archaeon]|nr:CoB--CoM heterodisulfide reductase iron-sulfur subunit A family protein [Methanophagales archaeon]MCW3141925.1 CoB--CoM heterodisulfide reductase iron-sulfur subunit A family protein [Methanophagales archaeon]
MATETKAEAEKEMEMEREKQGAIEEGATRDMMDSIKNTVEKSLLEKIEEKEVDVVPEALVIGGGIAGMYASLDIADAGFKVHLVERTPSIGGHMAQLDKTFPTLDCSACILTPRLVDVGVNPNINLMSCSEVIGVEGSIGNFKVKVLKHAKYVDEAKCTGCMMCEEACRLKSRFPNEFDLGLMKRAPIYRPFPFAIPAAYTIDAKSCLMLTKGKCGKATLESTIEAVKKRDRGEEITKDEAPPCVLACGPNCIHHDMQDEVVELNVGAIIIATGFDIIDPTVAAEYKYGVYPNVIHGLEFERYSSASGPTFGKIIVPGTNKEPKDVVFLSCVGSRNKQTGYEYCSRVCCMYLAKQAHLLQEKVPDCNITVCYQDVRAFGKGFEEFYDRVKGEGLSYRRGLAAEIYKNPGSERVIVRGEDTMLGEPYELEADLVVLGIGLKPSEGSEKLLKMLGVSQTVDNFAKEAHPKLRPVDTDVEGVFITGCAQGPKDIPDSVAQGKAAASAVLSLLARGKAKIRPSVAEMGEEMCIGYKSLREMVGKIGA